MTNNTIPLFMVFMADTAANAAADVLESGFIGQGPKVDEFEDKLSRYFRVPQRNLLTFNAATNAEHLAYHLLKNRLLLIFLLKRDRFKSNGQAYKMEMKY